MPRLIDADALEKILMAKGLARGYFTRQAVINEIKFAPTIEAEPVRHGTWKLLQNGDGVCDQCHVILKNVWDEDGWLHFCSCCGAKMDGGAEQ